MFALLAALLMRAAISITGRPVALASPGWAVAGAALVAFGSVYPHFLHAETWVAYVYGAPFGLLPCPTLAVVLGVTVAVDGLRSTRWCAPLSAAGLLYGFIGIAILRVSLDLGLLMGAIALAILTAGRSISGRVGATTEERRRGLAGDNAIPAAADTLTHAITIAAPPDAIWPWLVQMGAGNRAGWYSYDFVDNGRRPSATTIVRELQELAVGMVFPAVPGATDGFILLAFDPQQSLLLGWPGAAPVVTWAFRLEHRGGSSTRLLVRVRAARGYRFRGWPVGLSRPLIRVVHFVMQRKQLLEIARRAESASRKARAAA
jgi:hypothetical protein